MKKLTAFTVAESLIVLVVIGTFVTITIASTLNLGKIKEEKILNTSRAFYASILNAYREIILYESSDMSTITSAAANEDTLADFFVEYLGGEAVSCEDKDFNTLDGEEGENCAYFPGGIRAKIYYDPQDPPGDVDKKDYYNKEDPTLDSTTNAYGYITYTYKDSLGAFGKDTFRIAFGLRDVK